MCLNWRTIQIKSNYSFLVAKQSYWFKFIKYVFFCYTDCLLYHLRPRTRSTSLFYLVPWYRFVATVSGFRIFSVSPAVTDDIKKLKT